MSVRLIGWLVLLAGRRDWTGPIGRCSLPCPGCCPQRGEGLARLMPVGCQDSRAGLRRLREILSAYADSLAAAIDREARTRDSRPGSTGAPRWPLLCRGALRGLPTNVGAHHHRAVCRLYRHDPCSWCPSRAAAAAFAGTEHWVDV